MISICFDQPAQIYGFGDALKILKQQAMKPSWSPGTSPRLPIWGLGLHWDCPSLVAAACVDSKSSIRQGRVGPDFAMTAHVKDSPVWMFEPPILGKTKNIKEWRAQNQSVFFISMRSKPPNLPAGPAPPRLFRCTWGLCPSSEPWVLATLALQLDVDWCAILSSYRLIMNDAMLIYIIRLDRIGIWIGIWIGIRIRVSGRT